MSQFAALPKFVQATLLVVWVILGFTAAQLLMFMLISLLLSVGIPLSDMSRVVLNLAVGAGVYGAGLFIVAGLPAWIRHVRLKQLVKSLGLSRGPKPGDIVWMLCGFAIYYIGAIALIYVASLVLPNFNVEQRQELGFTSLRYGYEYAAAFVTFIILAPFAEELLFRGYLFTRLRRRAPFIVSALITSVLFGIVHMQLNVGIDTFVLSMVMCFLYERSGSLWPAILLHMIKNTIALSYLLFVAGIG